MLYHRRFMVEETCFRIKFESVAKEVERLVRSEPERVCQYPEAVKYLASTHNVEADVPEVCS